MPDSPIDYSAVLADLKVRRAHIDTMIAALEGFLGMQSPAITGPQTAGVGSPEIGPGAFLGMKIVDAVVSLLTTRRQALKTEDIVDALKRGGMIFSGDTPTNTVGSVLNRDFKSGGEIVSVGRGTWALAEWHPRLRRQPAKPVTEAAPSAVPIMTVAEPPKPVEAAKEANPEQSSQDDSENKIPTQTVTRTPLKPKKTVDDFDDDIPF